MPSGYQDLLEILGLTARGRLDPSGVGFQGGLLDQRGALQAALSDPSLGPMHNESGFFGSLPRAFGPTGMARSPEFLGLAGLESGLAERGLLDSGVGEERIRMFLDAMNRPRPSRGALRTTSTPSEDLGEPDFFPSEPAPRRLPGQTPRNAPAPPPLPFAPFDGRPGMKTTTPGRQAAPPPEIAGLMRAIQAAKDAEAKEGFNRALLGTGTQRRVAEAEVYAAGQTVLPPGTLTSATMFDPRAMALSETPESAFSKALFAPTPAKTASARELAEDVVARWRHAQAAQFALAKQGEDLRRKRLGESSQVTETHRGLDVQEDQRLRDLDARMATLREQQGGTLSPQQQKELDTARSEVDQARLARKETLRQGQVLRAFEDVETARKEAEAEQKQREVEDKMREDIKRIHQQNTLANFVGGKITAEAAMERQEEGQYRRLANRVGRTMPGSNIETSEMLKAVLHPQDLPSVIVQLQSGKSFEELVAENYKGLGKLGGLGFAPEVDAQIEAAAAQQQEQQDIAGILSGEREVGRGEAGVHGRFGGRLEKAQETEGRMLATRAGKRGAGEAGGPEDEARFSALETALGGGEDPGTVEVGGYKFSLENVRGTLTAVPFQKPTDRFRYADNEPFMFGPTAVQRPGRAERYIGPGAGPPPEFVEEARRQLLERLEGQGGGDEESIRGLRMARLAGMTPAQALQFIRKGEADEGVADRREKTRLKQLARQRAAASKERIRGQIKTASDKADFNEAARLRDLLAEVSDRLATMFDQIDSGELSEEFVANLKRGTKK